MILEITERARPEIENLTQRTANSVMPEMKSQKETVRVKMWPADCLKTRVFWQALVNGP